MVEGLIKLTTAAAFPAIASTTTTVKANTIHHEVITLEEQQLPETVVPLPNAPPSLLQIPENMSDKLEDHLLAPHLEPHVDVDFSVGELQQPPASESVQQPEPTSAATSVVSSTTGITGGPEVNDDASSAAEENESSQVPKIVAAGKGMALYMPPIFQKVLELSGKERPNIVYVGTASFDKNENFERHSKKFISKGCDITRVDVAEKDTVPAEEEMRRLIVDWADVLVFSGGNTLFALLRWKETGLDLLIKEAAEKGTVLVGGSAGAGCWFDSMHSDSLRPDNVKRSDIVKNEMDDEELTDWDYVKISGLGIVPTPGNIMAVPHFDTTGTNDISRSEHATEIVADEADIPGAIGIDNNAALIVEGDKAMVVSGDGEATVHVVVQNEDTKEISTAPLNPTDEPVPIEELIGIVNPATADHTDTLEEHVETDFAVAEDLLPRVRANSIASSAGDESAEGEPATIKIVAAGRMRALQMPPVFEKVIELSGKEQPRIVYIGTASFDRTDKFNLCTKAFRDLECEIERLDVSEPGTVPLMEEMRRLVVEWADVLLCSGGNTLHALLQWKETGLDLLLKEAAEKGTVLCGGSAGAGCWFSSIHSDSLRPDNARNAEYIKNELDDDELTNWDFVKINGLGILPAMAVPHFDVTGTNDISRSEHAEQVLVAQQDGMPAIGIDENAALVVDGDKAMVVSGDGEATCHVVVADERTGETVTVSLVPEDEPMLLEEMVSIAQK